MRIICLQYPLYLSSTLARVGCIFSTLDFWHRNEGFSMFWVFIWTPAHLHFLLFSQSLVLFCYLLHLSFRTLVKCEMFHIILKRV